MVLYLKNTIMRSRGLIFMKTANREYLILIRLGSHIRCKIIVIFKLKIIIN